MHRMMPFLFKKSAYACIHRKGKSVNMQGQDLGCKGRAFTFTFINFYVLILLLTIIFHILIC